MRCNAITADIAQFGEGHFPKFSYLALNTLKSSLPLERKITYLSAMASAYETLKHSCIHYTLCFSETILSQLSNESDSDWRAYYIHLIICSYVRGYTSLLIDADTLLQSSIRYIIFNHDDKRRLILLSLYNAVQNIESIKEYILTLNMKWVYLRRLSDDNEMESILKDLEWVDKFTSFSRQFQAIHARFRKFTPSRSEFSKRLSPLYTSEEVESFLSFMPTTELFWYAIFRKRA
jgi:hypothetical protein